MSSGIAGKLLAWESSLFFKWMVHGLVLWVTWVDYCLVCGKKEEVLADKKQLMDRFNCDEISELMEYI